MKSFRKEEDLDKLKYGNQPICYAAYCWTNGWVENVMLKEAEIQHEPKK